MIRSAWRFVVRCARTGKTLASKRGGLPVWLRALFWALLAITQPIVGPVDDILLLVPIALTYAFYRPQLTAAWAQSARPASV